MRSPSSLALPRLIFYKLLNDPLLHVENTQSEFWLYASTSCEYFHDAGDYPLSVLSPIKVENKGFDMEKADKKPVTQSSSSLLWLFLMNP